MESPAPSLPDPTAAMAWCYNGCAPNFTSCSHNGVRNAYKAGVEGMLAAFGPDYWNEVMDIGPMAQ